eukprot:scaffold251_cov230-Pinguiococcus_pyrenoidosus.AAC.4
MTQLNRPTSRHSRLFGLQARTGNRFGPGAIRQVATGQIQERLPQLLRRAALFVWRSRVALTSIWLSALAAVPSTASAWRRSLPRSGSALARPPTVRTLLGHSVEIR